MKQTDDLLLAKNLAILNNRIRALCRANSPSLQKVVDWIFSAPGKQIRPILTFLCYGLDGRTRGGDPVEAAAITEICHTASLVHDDVIDGADMRRGVLSVQKKFGKEMAVYTGDFMIFSVMRHTRLANRLWYRDMLDYLQVMCDGEVSQYDHQYDLEITEEQNLVNIVGKTSSMFQLACTSGAYEGGIRGRRLEAVDSFARHLGILFQFRDDYMDFVATSEASRKSAHEDFRSGYYTLPAIHAFRDPVAGPQLREIALGLKESGGVATPEQTARINELVAAAGGFDYTIGRIREEADAALAALDVFDESPSKERLRSFVRRLCTSVLEMPAPSVPRA